MIPNDPAGETVSYAANGTSFTTPIAAAVAANVIAAIPGEDTWMLLNVIVKLSNYDIIKFSFMFDFFLLEASREVVTYTQNMRHMLSKMCTKRDTYRPDTGYGVLSPAGFFKAPQELLRIYEEVLHGT